jgi:hypothetical protein
LQAPTISQRRTALSVADAMVAFSAWFAQPLFSVVPFAGQPHAIPTGTTPAPWQVCGAVQAWFSADTKKQLFASLVQTEKLAPPPVGQK